MLGVGRWSALTGCRCRGDWSTGGWPDATTILPGYAHRVQGEMPWVGAILCSLIIVLGLLGVIFRRGISRAAKRNATLLGQPSDVVGLGPTAQGVLAAALMVLGIVGLVFVLVHALDH